MRFAVTFTNLFISKFVDFDFVMAAQFTDMWVSTIVGKLFEKVMDMTVKNCPGHRFKCAVLHRCHQLSLFDKLVMYYEVAKSEIIEELSKIFEEHSKLFSCDHNQKSGMISFAVNYLRASTPESIYFGKVYKEQYEVVLQDEEKNKKKKRKTAIDPVTQAYNQAFESYSF